MPGASTATPGPVEATVNGTFRPTGRDSSDWYFTIEGVSNGTYARWGVAEFDTSGLFSGAILDITGFELTLTRSNAYFTKDGAVAFFITEDTATNIGPVLGWLLVRTPGRGQSDSIKRLYSSTVSPMSRMILRSKGRTIT